MDIQQMFKKAHALIEDIENEYNDVIAEQQNLNQTIEDLNLEISGLNFMVNLHSQDVCDYEDKIRILEEDLAGVRETISFILFNKQETPKA